MPEVPELNVMCSAIENIYIGKKHSSFVLHWTKQIKTSESEFNEGLSGAKLVSVSREGKEMHLHFDNKNVLGVHLMLTGAMTKLPDSSNIKYPIFELLFEDGSGLKVSDRLGQARAILNPKIPIVPDIEGSEFTLEYFTKIVKGHKFRIKELIQFQKLIRGIGNAYADEVLWHSKISPWSISRAIPDEKIEDLYNAIIEVTKEATDQLKSVKLSEFDFSLENKDHRFIHNSKRKHSPDGQEILIDKMGASKTYYTASQVLYN